MVRGAIDISDVVTFNIHVAIPADKAVLLDFIERINTESGLDDSGQTYGDFCDEESVDPHSNPDGFDCDEFALFVLDNRDVAPNATGRLITHFVMDSY